jgi:hypothetical protein
MTTSPPNDVFRRAADYLTRHGNERLTQIDGVPASEMTPAPAWRRSRVVVGGAVMVAVLGGSGLAAAAITGSLPVSLPLFSSDNGAADDGSATEFADGTSDSTSAPDDGTATTTPDAEAIDAGGQPALGGAIGPKRPAGTTTFSDASEPSDPANPNVPGTGPEILEVSGPGTVQAGTTLRVRWTINDPSLAQTWMLVGGPYGWVTFCPFPVNAIGVDGTSRGPRFEATCEVPQTLPNGSYTAFIYATDGSDARSEVAVDFTVVGGSSDVAPPMIDGVTLSAGIVEPGDSIVVRWRATDESGVDDTSPWVSGPNGFVVDPTTGEPVAQWILGTLVSGTTTDGIYEATLRISPNASAGTYQLWFGARDTVGNKTFELAQNQERGFGTFEILDNLIRLPVIR